MSKISLGSEHSVPWNHVTNTVECIKQLKEMGAKMVALEQTEKSVSLTQILSTQDQHSLLPLCMLLGNEVAGLSSEALALCDLVCDLPMRGVKKSLNVSIAFGISAYLLSEKLLPPKIANLPMII